MATNYGLAMCNSMQMCFAANKVCSHVIVTTQVPVWKMADYFHELSAESDLNAIKTNLVIKWWINYNFELP